MEIQHRKSKIVNLGVKVVTCYIGFALLLLLSLFLYTTVVRLLAPSRMSFPIPAGCPILYPQQVVPVLGPLAAEF
jgi:hypothetical protein